MLIASKRNYADFSVTGLTSSDVPHQEDPSSWRENLDIDYVRVKDGNGRAILSYFYQTNKPAFLAVMQVGCVMVLKELAA